MPNVHRLPLLVILLLTGSLLWMAPVATAQEAASDSAETQPAPSQSGESQPTETQPAATQPAATQEAQAPPTEDLTKLTVEEVQSLISRIEADQALSDNVRVEAVNLCRQAIEQLALAESFRQKAEEFRKERERAPALREELPPRVQQLKEAKPEPPQPEPDASLEQLSRRLADVEGELKTRQDAVRELENAARNRAERRTAIPDLLAAAAARQEAATRGLADSATAAGGAPQLQMAKRALLTGQRNAAQEEQRAYQEELQLYDARSDILALRREEARLLAAQAETRVNAWRRIVAERREQEVAQQREQAEADLRRAPPEVRELAQQNIELTNEWDKLGSRIKASNRMVQEVRAELDALSSQFDTIRSHGELGEKSDLFGPLMRKLRSELARLRRHERDLELTGDEMSKAQLRSAEIETELDKLQDRDAAMERELIKVSFDDTELDEDELIARLYELLDARREVLQKLKRDYDKYYGLDLINENVALNSLLSRVDEVANFIDERMLWVRSTVPAYRVPLTLDWAAWGSALFVIGDAWWSELEDFWGLYGLAAVLYLTFLALLPRVRRDLRTTGELVAKPATDRYALTLRGVLDSFILALPVPLLLWGAAWRLHALEVAYDPAAFDLTRAAAEGLAVAASIYFMLLSIRHLCRRYGVFATHFRWNVKGLGVMRRDLIWFAPLVLPLAFVAVAAERHANLSISASVGRAAFLIAMVLAVVFVAQVFHPNRGAFAYYYARHSDAIVTRLRWPTYAVVLLVIIGLAAASFAGYHYTAIVFCGALLATFALSVGLVLLHGLAVRWVVYTQRKLAIEEARRRREAQAAEAAEKGETVAPEVDLDDAALNIGAIGEQTRQLLASFAWLGVILIFWVSWADLLPAFSFLREVTLWKYTTQVPIENAAGEALMQTDVQHITLANALLAGLILAIAFIFARNMPGLLEIAILRRIPLDTGGRFAISAISRYAIAVVGFALAFGAIGIGWSQVQWLVAAISVGLGFGLQEIFANFISGLILLFERPIRIGDTVTVGDVNGTVTRIRIRATTITDWDRKELIIPNKEFVTGHVVNWTLTDQYLRFIVRVGIAYGSDVKRAKQILQQIAHDNPRIVSQPKPHVWFLEFGDNSLNFEVRAFAKDIDDWMLARDELHFAIDAAFREAGIEIAFPQRDIHIRSLPPALARQVADAQHADAAAPGAGQG